MNHRRRSRQIYSLLPLATREPLHKLCLFFNNTSDLTSYLERLANAKRDNMNKLNNGGGGRIRTIEGGAGRFTVCSLWPLGEPLHKLCLFFNNTNGLTSYLERLANAKRNNMNKLNNGGGGRIRTIEGGAGRFTVCSLWPLGNPSTNCVCSLTIRMT